LKIYLKIIKFHSIFNDSSIINDSNFFSIDKSESFELCFAKCFIYKFFLYIFLKKELKWDTFNEKMFKNIDFFNGFKFIIEKNIINCPGFKEKIKKNLNEKVTSAQFLKLTKLNFLSIPRTRKFCLNKKKCV
jgi:hypothetical protein